MKNFRHIALTALLTIGSFAAITYTSCTKDACKDVTCQNGGTCSGGNCTCPTGYEGTSCETLSITKFVKNWIATDKTGSTTISYTGVISPSGTDVTSAIIGNSFSDNFFTIGPITATISGNTITIPTQKPDGTSSDYSLSGTGTYANGAITWSYTITQTSTSATQVYTGTWQ